MKFDIHNRFTGEVQVTAEIECDADTHTSVKMGLAVKWCVKNGASLNRASLDGASLYGASLYGANLDCANLNRANLDGANLNGASLYGANLNRASLDGANLNGASLYGANLDWASLDGANLDGANLNGANGINDWVKAIQMETYPITYTAEILQIGCQRHAFAEWAAFTDAEIRRMDGVKALQFWAKWRGWIFQTVEMCPAKPTGYVAPDNDDAA